MTGAHFHLLVNHMPILGAFMAVALLLASMRWGQDVLQRTALALLFAVGVSAAAAKFTGDPAEDGVLGMPGVTRTAIHEHEEMADKAFIAAAALGLFAAIALGRWKNSPLPRGVRVGALAGSVIVTVLMAYTGLLGGQIRHTEVRPGATAADAIAIEPPRARQSEPTTMQQ